MFSAVSASAARTTQPSTGRRSGAWKAIIATAPTHVIGAFTSTRIQPWMKFCTCDTSLVTRVISDGVPSLPAASSGSLCTAAYRPARSSAATSCEVRHDSQLRITAASAPAAATPSITPP